MNSASALIGANVRVELYARPTLSDIPGWDGMARGTKLDALRGIPPDGSFERHNAVVAPYREHLSEHLNPEITPPEDTTAHSIAFGDDGSDPSEPWNLDGLQNEVYRQAIDDHADRTRGYAATVLLQSGDAVGLNLLEAAIATTGGEGNSEDMYINRVLLNDERLDPKDDEHAVVVTIEMNYKDADQVTS